MDDPAGELSPCHPVLLTGAVTDGRAAPAKHQAAGCRREERGDRRAVGQRGPVQVLMPSGPHAAISRASLIPASSAWAGPGAISWITPIRKASCAPQWSPVSM